MFLQSGLPEPDIQSSHLITLHHTTQYRRRKRE
jgi:hypothetical protein